MAILAQMSESRVIEACQSGDRAAFRHLFELYKDRVYSIALHTCRDEQTAQDVTQEVFVKLFRTIGQFRRQSSFSTWLYRVVVNTALNQKRKGRRLISLDEEQRQEEPGVEHSPEDVYRRRQLLEAIRTAVAGLEKNLQIPLLLRYMEGLSYSEIAETLGWSIGTVSSRLSRAHKSLGLRLADYRDELK